MKLKNRQTKQYIVYALMHVVYSLKKTEDSYNLCVGGRREIQLGSI